MKGMKGKFLKKLKSIKSLGAIKQQGRVLLVRASDGLLDSSPIPASKNNNGVLQNSSRFKEKQQSPEIIDVSELMRDLEDDEEVGVEDSVGNKENIDPGLIKVKDPLESMENSSFSESGSYGFRDLPLAEIDVNSFRKPDSMSFDEVSDNGESEKSNLGDTQMMEMDGLGFRKPILNSSTLFDPNLLAAFEQVASEHMRAQEAIRKAKIEEKRVGNDEEPPQKMQRVEESPNPLLEFEEKCPPGGSDAVILYTTSLRGIRKTFEDCSRIIFLLESFRILYVERDVSMHLGFREEMWNTLGGKVVPPRLFIKGRYIGGADQVVGLHEQGRLIELFEGLPRDQSTSPCDGCGGERFVMCSNCNGSRRVRPNEGGEEEDSFVHCPECNENGRLIEFFEGLPRDQSTSPCDGCGGVRFVMCSNCNGSRRVRPNEGGEEEDSFVQCPECNENGLIVCSMCC